MLRRRLAQCPHLPAVSSAGGWEHEEIGRADSSPTGPPCLDANPMERLPDWPAQNASIMPITPGRDFGLTDQLINLLGDADYFYSLTEPGDLE